MLIGTAVCCPFLLAYYYFFSDRVHFIAGCVACPILLVFMVYACFREKRADRRAEKKRTCIEDGSYFRSAEQRQKYLDFAQSGGWENMKGRGMKQDMCRRYRNSSSRMMILMGAFFLAISPGALYSEQPLIIIPWLALTAFVLYTGISGYMGAPVRKWLKETKYDMETLEQSYCTGKLLTNGKDSINIGSEFVIMTTEKMVYAFRTEQAGTPGRKVVRVKNYQDNIYAGEEYRYCLTVPVREEDGTTYTAECCLREEQLELALNEMNRHISADTDSSADYSEDRTDETVI